MKNIRSLTLTIVMLLCSINIMAQEHVMAKELAEPKVTLPDSIDMLAYYRGTSPLSWAGFDHWLLHPGLNIQLEASVFAEFGKHARHGVGFAQNISMLYAKRLLPKLSLSFGGGLGNMTWQNDTFRELNLSATLNYQFNERLEGFIYGNKSMVQSNRRLPWYLQDIGNFGDRLGVGAKYTFSPSFSVEVRFEERQPRSLGF